MSPHSPHLMRIRQCFPELEFNHIQLDTDGKSSDILIINHERVFRFPRSEAARQSLWREKAALQLVGRYASLPVPFFDHVEDDFATYRLIPGEILPRNTLLQLPAEVQERILLQLGQFLAGLHAIPAPEMDAAGIGYAPGWRRAEQWLEFYQQVERDLFPSMLSHTRQWVQAHFAPLLNDAAWLEAPLTFINGNLGPYHILYDDQSNQLTGILDFGAAGLGDPAQDAAVLLYYYGESLLKRMAPAYPALPGLLDRARFMAGTVELQWALDGVRRGNCFGTLGYIGSARDMQPFGSSW